jgi:F-type H+-transporting ATPase subunit delta
MSGRFDEQELAVAGVYARSLLALAEPAGQADAVGEELAALAAMLDESPSLRRQLADPFVDPEDRRQLLESSLRNRANDLLVDALQVANRKGRLGLLPALAEAYRRALAELRHEVEVEVTTAVPLNDAQREKLRAAAGRYTGRTARLVEAVNASLLGGMVVKIGDRKIDNSVSKDLRRLGGLLAECGSKELQSGRSVLAEANQERQP